MKGVSEADMVCRVANLVTPTKQSKSLQSKDWRLLCYKARSCLYEYGLCDTKVLACKERVLLCMGATIYDHRAKSHRVWLVAR